MEKTSYFKVFMQRNFTPTFYGRTGRTCHQGKLQYLGYTFFFLKELAIFPTSTFIRDLHEIIHGDFESVVGQKFRPCFVTSSVI